MTNKILKEKHGVFYFSKPPNGNFNRYFIGVTDAVREGDSLRWSDDLKKWVNPHGKYKSLWLSSYCNHVSTFKAFRSFVRRHDLDYAVLSSKFIGYDIAYTRNTK